MILENTLTDKSLIALTEAIKTNRIDSNNLLLIPFKRVFAELTVTEDGIILRNQILIPEKLQDDIIKIAHEGQNNFLDRKFGSQILMLK